MYIYFRIKKNKIDVEFIEFEKVVEESKTMLESEKTRLENLDKEYTKRLEDLVVKEEVVTELKKDLNEMELELKEKIIVVNKLEESLIKKDEDIKMKEIELNAKANDLDKLDDALDNEEEELNSLRKELESQELELEFEKEDMERLNDRINNMKKIIDEDKINLDIERKKIEDEKEELYIYKVELDNMVKDIDSREDEINKKELEQQLNLELLKKPSPTFKSCSLSRNDKKGVRVSIEFNENYEDINPTSVFVFLSNNEEEKWYESNSNPYGCLDVLQSSVIQTKKEFDEKIEVSKYIPISSLQKEDNKYYFDIELESSDDNLYIRNDFSGTIGLCNCMGSTSRFIYI